MAPVSLLLPAAKDARHAAQGLKAEGEVYRRLHSLPRPSPASQLNSLLGRRVRVARVSGTALNKLHGLSGEVRAVEGGRALVVLDQTAETLLLRPSQLQLAPPAPAPTEYNVGTGQYALPRYSNNGQPRRCRAGSGALSYSTRRAPQQGGSAVPPPESGALLPRPNPPVAFREARKAGSLPVRLGGERGATLRWVDPITEASLDVKQVRAVLVEGGVHGR